MLRVLAFAGAMALLLACASKTSPPAPAPAPPPSESAAATGPLPGDQLDQLVARVALYPDALLAIVLPASTQPTQIVEALRFLEARERDPKLEPSASWDDAVNSLLNYPDVIRGMNQDLAWTVKLGTAVSTQLDDVMDAIQQVRTRAVAAGHLKTNDKWIVTQEKGIIRIESADPDVIYIPIYDETQIYVESSSTTVVTSYPPYPCYWCPGAYYGMGMMWGFGWYAGGIYWDDDDIDIDIDHDRPDRPDRPGDRPRPTPHDGAGRNQWKPKPSQPISGAGAGGAARPGTLPARGETRPSSDSGRPQVSGGAPTRESLSKLPSSYEPKYSGGSRRDSYGGYQRGQDAVRASDRGAQSRGVSSSPSRSYGGSSYGGYGRGSSASSWGSRGSMSRGGMGGGMRGGGGGRGGGRR